MSDTYTNVIELSDEALEYIRNESGGLDFNRVVPRPPASCFKGIKEHGEWTHVHWGVGNLYTKLGRRHFLGKMVFFDSVGNLPQPVLKALSKKFPDIVIKLTYTSGHFNSDLSEDDVNLCAGEIMYKDGEIIFERYYGHDNLDDTKFKAVTAYVRTLTSRF